MKEVMIIDGAFSLMKVTSKNEGKEKQIVKILCYFCAIYMAAASD